MDVINIEEKAYVREELKQLFDEHKTEIKYKDYYDGDVSRVFGFLEQNKPILVKNYPWGFRLKTTIKYWIETTKRGGRFCSQTINPKTGQWCKPKKTTYSAIMFLTIDKTGKVTYTTLSYNDDKTKIEVYRQRFKEYMNDGQFEEFIKVAAYTKAMENVTFEVVARKFKNKETGEITESVPVFDINNYVEVTEKGEEECKI